MMMVDEESGHRDELLYPSIGNIIFYFRERAIGCKRIGRRLVDGTACVVDETLKGIFYIRGSLL